MMPPSRSLAALFKSAREPLLK